MPVILLFCFYWPVVGHADSMFLILRKNISLNKSKPFENPFNIAKNTEFEVITSRHFKNLISPKPAWNSQ